MSDWTQLASAGISAVAMVFAAKAEKNSRPVGNGFTKHVMDDLKFLKIGLINHLEQHDKK